MGSFSISGLVMAAATQAVVGWSVAWFRPCLSEAHTSLRQKRVNISNLMNCVNQELAQLPFTSKLLR
ncbi:uncharacterized protein THITE_2119883 [Thermothielavioides terrestris NRRL 8126]|uniref:Secreted protein n=1 Tax=Thermothielavioides terrestris (strain ATCC 38088 / NRRL 8126) TaxID=578455 RepID=G2R904_THETT|nr:uncharacterized protein THITE_2119883 [Thermothielavioides terrestris NRRL 8126]AEO69454.1 hypothetical protein THITE_2119883 [Thermothielavioides terrestris NRRL 8126]